MASATGSFGTLAVLLERLPAGRIPSRCSHRIPCLPVLDKAEDLHDRLAYPHSARNWRSAIAIACVLRHHRMHQALYVHRRPLMGGSRGRSSSVRRAMQLDLYSAGDDVPDLAAAGTDTGCREDTFSLSFPLAPSRTGLRRTSTVRRTAWTRHHHWGSSGSIGAPRLQAAAQPSDRRAHLAGGGHLSCSGVRAIDGEVVLIAEIGAVACAQSNRRGRRGLASACWVPGPERSVSDAFGHQSIPRRGREGRAPSASLCDNVFQVPSLVMRSSVLLTNRTNPVRCPGWIPTPVVAGRPCRA